MKNFNAKRLVSVLLSLIMFTQLAPMAFASELNDTSNQVASLEPLSEVSDISREEALEILGITEAELGNGQLYVMNVPVQISPTSTNNTNVLNSGETFTLNSVTFSGENTGGTLLAFNASKAKFGVVWKWVNRDYNNFAILHVNLTNPRFISTFEAHGIIGYDDPETGTFYSDWEPISNDFTYHFEYRADWGYYEPGFPLVRATVQVVVAAV